MDWKKWFDRYNGVAFKIEVDPVDTNYNFMETVYQAFKARIMDEVYLRNPQPFDCDLMGDVE